MLRGVSGVLKPEARWSELPGESGCQDSSTACRQRILPHCRIANVHPHDNAHLCLRIRADVLRVKIGACVNSMKSHETSSKLRVSSIVEQRP